MLLLAVPAFALDLVVPSPDAADLEAALVLLADADGPHSIELGADQHLSNELTVDVGTLEIRATAGTRATISCSQACLELRGLTHDVTLTGLDFTGGTRLLDHRARNLTVVDCSFRNASIRALYSPSLSQPSTLSIVGSTFHNNTGPGEGGAIYVVGRTLEISDSFFTANNATGGGAIATDNADVLIERTHFNDNVADASSSGGGAIKGTQGSLTVRDSRFTGNEQVNGTGSGSGGGAVNTQQTTTVIDNSWFCANTTTRSGGALYASIGQLEITNTVFWQNGVSPAYTPARAGAVHAGSLSGYHIEHNTFAGNLAGEGSSLHLAGLSGTRVVRHNLIVDDVHGGLYVQLGNQIAAPFLNAFYDNGLDQTASDATPASAFTLLPRPPVAAACTVAALSPHNTAIVGAAAGLTFGALQDLDSDTRFDEDDCDDADPTIYVGAPEICGDGIDQDCDGDDSPSALAYADLDGDGFGGMQQAEVCPGAVGYSPHNTDCDDTNPLVHPLANEFCDGVDTNCSGDESDAADALPFFTDADGDGHGTGAALGTACALPSGTSSQSNDCNDGDATRSPSAVEVCNGADDTCDGLADEGVTTSRYPDVDGDGFGSGPSFEGCPSDGAPEPGDCNDTNPLTFPGAPEVCDEQDNDCDGAPEPDRFVDNDGDGFGAVRSPECEGVPVSGDCNDERADTFPGAVEVVEDGVDQDCDGLDGVGVELATSCATSPPTSLGVVLLGVFALRRRQQSASAIQ